MEKTNPKTPQPETREKELAALSYLWVFSLVMLLAKRDSLFIQHHARRGVVLFILSLLLWPVAVLRYGEFVVLALMILGFVSAATGSENNLPILSEIADGTLSKKHFKRYWHHTKHGAIRIVKPEHITPAFREELKEQKKELTEQEKLLEEEKRMVEMEERKLSALYHRLNEDEKELHHLEDEVHHLEEEVKELKK